MVYLSASGNATHCIKTREFTFFARCDPKYDYFYQIQMYERMKMIYRCVNIEMFSKVYDIDTSL